MNADGGKLESLGYKGGYRVDVDIPESSWIEAPNFHDILVFNTGHWYLDLFFPIHFSYHAMKTMVYLLYNLSWVGGVLVVEIHARILTSRNLA